MLGYAPLAALPLAAVSGSLVAADEQQMSASGGITFGGSASAGLKLPMAASGGLTFGGSGAMRIEVYTGASGGLVFGGSPMLRVAGRPIVFTALPESFQFRSDGADFDFVTLTTSFDFRGVPE